MFYRTVQEGSESGIEHGNDSAYKVYRMGASENVEKRRWLARRDVEPVMLQNLPRHPLPNEEGQTQRNRDGQPRNAESFVQSNAGNSAKRRKSHLAAERTAGHLNRKTAHQQHNSIQRQEPNWKADLHPFTNVRVGPAVENECSVVQKEKDHRQNDEEHGDGEQRQNQRKPRTVQPAAIVWRTVAGAIVVASTKARRMHSTAVS